MLRFKRGVVRPQEVVGLVQEQHSQSRGTGGGRGRERGFVHAPADLQQRVRTQEELGISLLRLWEGLGESRHAGVTVGSWPILSAGNTGKGACF